ncbi:MAG: hypothetical protein ACOC0P_02155, partial [Planctomycetota bacterium]
LSGEPDVPESADASSGGDDNAVNSEAQQQERMRARMRSANDRRRTERSEFSVEGEALLETVPEGTFIALRSGRLTRSTVGGETIFIFDSDKDGGQDPPMVLAPSLLLERMERKAEERTDGLRFLVSGEVLSYRNRNYLIPLMMIEPYERTNLSY